MSYENSHHDWLSLIEISGPFLAVPVMKEAFPQGLEELDSNKRKRLRQAYDEWHEALELDDPQFDELHAAWIDEVLSRGLELDADGKGDVLKRANWCATQLKANLPEHGVTLSPDFAVVDEQSANKPLLLIQTYTQDVDLDAALKQDGLAATPADRMVELCRSLDCRLGLVTNGERWMLVDAPVGAVTTFASWYARIWSQEPITLQAFVHLLGIRRYFVDESEQLPALFDRSLKFQDEVTDALGEQVRRAVEVLIQTLDKADQDRNRELLHDVKEPELYEAALTVMMRLVFLLSAEERGLLLMGDERYEANYALSTLRMQLRKESEEILERRWDAWSRLLAIFRAVFGGIEHENLRLPALGGSLFDPDRFPFLEGRAKGSNWRSDAAKPLPIDNRTVLLLLEAIQQFQGRTLSYRALDVEQIGYVYEGLLERTVKRTDEVTLELDATKSAKTPWVKLAELDSARLDGIAQLAELLQERSGSSASRVRNDLVKAVDDTLADRLLTACLGDTKLRDRVKPYAHLLRTDPWGYPLVYPAGAFIVTTGSDRRETGTHYTPKSLTEAIVTETLTPVAYVGPAEGSQRDQWVLKSPAELLDLKICDPAMGSGAFLVQACRWLSDRLVEAWSQAEALGKTVSVDGEVLEAGASKEPLPRDSEARMVIARRLIAEKCLYGVDVNPLAVELAKLSIWLVTMAKSRPFGFLDHNLRYGDSLLGITDLDQLNYLDMKVGKGSEKKLFAQKIEDAVTEAVKLRLELRQCQILDISDVEVMANLDQKAREKLELPELIADAFVGEVLKAGGKKADVTMLSIEAGEAFQGENDACEALRRRAQESLNTNLPNGRKNRKTLHWCLEFPEVFSTTRPGFSAVIGNPPFVGGKKITGIFGVSFRGYLVHQVANGKKGVADLVAYFFLRANEICSNQSCWGLLATNTISEGDTREVALDQLVDKKADLYFVEKNVNWPGQAAVAVSLICGFIGEWAAFRRLNHSFVNYISPMLTDKKHWHPLRLEENSGLSFVGSLILGTGFLIDPARADLFLKKYPNYAEVLYPYLNGQDLNSNVGQDASRWVINFWDWPLYARDRVESRPVAADFPELLEILEKNVKPERDKNKRKIYREKWWQFGEKQKSLYLSIGRGDKFYDNARNSEIILKSVVVIPETTKYCLFSMIPTNSVLSHMLKIIVSDSFALLALLNSSFYDAWARLYSSSLETRLKFVPSDCFQNFPIPLDIQKNDSLHNLGKELERERCVARKQLNVGNTKLYNFVNDPSIDDDPIQTIRDLHGRIDKEFVDVYGWSDIDSNIGFHDITSLPKKDCLRYSVSNEARQEVLYRLAMLNKERYESEAKKGVSKPVSSNLSRRIEIRSDTLQGSLFDQEVGE